MCKSHFIITFRNVIVLSLVVCFVQVMDSQVTMCKYPFVFDAQAKTALLQTDAVIQMQVSVIRLISGFDIIFPAVSSRCCL